jgi:prepilin peptidase dependent protein B
MRRQQQGLSLVELMVGIAIGLVIVAAALFALTHHLRANRSLLVEARLAQDLRTAADLITRDLRRAGPLAQPDGGVRFSYPHGTEQWAYRLRSGVIEMQMGEGYWQAMTDANTVRVASLRITPQVQEIVLNDFCSQPCAEGSTTCPPRQTVRSLAIQIEAYAATDAAVHRSVQSTVRLRNDALTGACPT